jgi:hypothetical protein
MKYITMQVSNKKGLRLAIPIVFPNILVHAQVAAVLKVLLNEQFPGHHVKALSAGEVNSADMHVEAHGESTSLKLKARPEDTSLIIGNDYGAGFTS